MSLTRDDVVKIFDKLEIDPVVSADKVRGYVVVDGLRVASLFHYAGESPFPGRTADRFRMSMRLSVDELERFVACTISRAEYVGLLLERTPE